MLCASCMVNTLPPIGIAEMILLHMIFTQLFRVFRAFEVTFTAFLSLRSIYFIYLEGEQFVSFHLFLDS